MLVFLRYIHWWRWRRAALVLCRSYLDVRFVVPDFHKAVVKAAELVDFLLVLISHLLEE